MLTWSDERREFCVCMCLADEEECGGVRDPGVVQRQYSVVLFKLEGGKKGNVGGDDTHVQDGQHSQVEQVAVAQWPFQQHHQQQCIGSDA